LVTAPVVFLQSGLPLRNLTDANRRLTKVGADDYRLRGFETAVIIFDFFFYGFGRAIVFFFFLFWGPGGVEWGGGRRREKEGLSTAIFCLTIQRTVHAYCRHEAVLLQFDREKTRFKKQPSCFMDEQSVIKTKPLFASQLTYSLKN
jgi:hypothetical protein